MQGCGKNTVVLLMVVMQIGVATVENSMEVSQKTKNRTTIRPSRASLVAQLVKNPLAMQETPV